MDLKEQAQMSSEEEMNHWWISTRFQYIDRMIKSLKRTHPGRNSLSLLELGCGTGQNMAYLRNRSLHKKDVRHMVGVDSNLPKGFSRLDLTPDDHLQIDPPNPGEKYDLLLAMDVIEHIENDQEALTAWTEYLRPGSFVLITVPAFQILWSYQDVFLEHYRRYTKKSLIGVAEQAGLKPVKIHYAFSFIFPLVWFVRKILHRNKTEGQNDLQPTNPMVNGILKLLGRLEYRFGGCPFLGTSVIGIFEVPDSQV